MMLGDWSAIPSHRDGRMPPFVEMLQRSCSDVRGRGSRGAVRERAISDGRGSRRRWRPIWRSPGPDRARCRCSRGGHRAAQRQLVAVETASGQAVAIHLLRHDDHLGPRPGAQALVRRLPCSNAPLLSNVPGPSSTMLIPLMLTMSTPSTMIQPSLEWPLRGSGPCGPAAAGRAGEGVPRKSISASLRSSADSAAATKAGRSRCHARGHAHRRCGPALPLC